METSYARMIFVAVVIALTVLFAIVAVSRAEAHRISTSQAESTWYSYFNWHCGAGSYVCGTRKAGLQCWGVSGAPHRNFCRYEYTEHPVGGNNRWCRIEGELLHYDVYYWRKDC